MSKTATQSATKWAERAATAGGAYGEGARTTTKDQSANAIAAKTLWAAGVQEAVSKDRFAKGLQKSGKQGWLNGITEKGEMNYATGVSSQSASSSYSANSGKYDGARNAAASMPRAAKGSPANLARVGAVVSALRAIKMA